MAPTPVTSSEPVLNLIYMEHVLGRCSRTNRKVYVRVRTWPKISSVVSKIKDFWRSQEAA